MKNNYLPLLLILISSFGAIAQTTVWSEDFSVNDLTGWTLIDDDAEVAAGPDDWQIEDYASYKAATSYSYYNDVITPDNYLISPAIDLSSASGTITLKWEVLAQDTDYDNENYSVYVGTSNDHTVLVASSTTFTENLAGVNSLTERTLDISSFAGEGVVHFAFRHHNSTGESSIQVTNLSVDYVVPVSPVVWSEDFSVNDLTGWTLIDDDAEVAAGPDDWQIEDYASYKAATSYSYYNDVITPDNYLISPAIDLSSVSGTIILKWDVLAQDTDYDNENYTVYVGTTNDHTVLVASGTTFTENLAGVNSLTERTLDISSFAGEGVMYFAFRHHNSTGESSIQVTNLSVETESEVTPPTGITLTQNSDEIISYTQGFSGPIGCAQADNIYVREFDLSNQGVTGAIDINSVSVGIAQNTVVQDVIVRVWNSDGTTAPGTIMADSNNLIGERTVSLGAYGDLGNFNPYNDIVELDLGTAITVSGTATHILLEFTVPLLVDGNPNPSAFTMGESLGQTVDSYWMSDGCGAPSLDTTENIFGMPLNYYLMANATENNSPLSVGDVLLIENDIFVYPNPTANILNIKLSPSNSILNVKLFDLQGKAHRALSFDNQIDLSSLRTGIYILQIETAHGVISKRIVKK